MRFILAIAAFVVAATMIVFGIAQRTVWLAPAAVSEAVVVKGDALYTVISGDVLAQHPGAQTLAVSGAKTVFMAYGRDADVRDWLGADTHAVVSIDEETGALTSKLESNAVVDPAVEDDKPIEEVPALSEGDAAAAEADGEIVNPAGSDLWLDEFSHENRLDTTVSVPEGVSVIIASDGTEPAPDNIVVSWPLNNATPWAGPLLVGGAFFALIGLLLLLAGLWGIRRGRGPRRNMPKGPRIPRIAMMPKPKAIGAKDIVPPAPLESGHRAPRPRIAIVPMLLITGLALSGCSADLWPNIEGEPTANPSASATPTPGSTDAPLVEELPATAVTLPQLERIVRKIAVTTADADAAADTALLATRFTGPALALRQGNYAIRALVPDYALPDPIPATPLEIVLPQQTASWPRTVFSVILNSADPTTAPTALLLTQASPRENYLVEYAMKLEPDAQTPKVAPAGVGATIVPPDNKLLLLPPSQLAAAYADVLMQGEASPSYPLFRAEGDSLRGQVGLPAQQALIAALPATATMAFSKVPGPGTLTPLATLESGALVAVNIAETEVIKPAETGATVSGSGTVKAMLQIEASTKGIQTDYVTEMLFYIPAAGSSEQIVLLGYAQGLISAVELP